MKNPVNNQTKIARQLFFRALFYAVRGTCNVLSLHKILSVAFQIFSNIFRASSRHILDKKNKTEFALV